MPHKKARSKCIKLISGSVYVTQMSALASAGIYILHARSSWRCLCADSKTACMGPLKLVVSIVSAAIIGFASVTKLMHALRQVIYVCIHVYKQ